MQVIIAFLVVVGTLIGAAAFLFREKGPSQDQDIVSMREAVKSAQRTEEALKGIIELVKKLEELKRKKREKEGN